MATDLEKTKNLGNFTAEMVISLASGAYNLLGTAAGALSHPVGEQILKGFENKMGLDIAGDTPKEIITDITNIFVDELGFAEEMIITEPEEGHYKIVVNHCFLRPLTDEYLALTNSNTPNSFICPIQNSIKAAFARMGYKMILQRDAIEDHGSVITFEPF